MRRIAETREQYVEIAVQRAQALPALVVPNWKARNLVGARELLRDASNLNTMEIVRAVEPLAERKAAAKLDEAVRAHLGREVLVHPVKGFAEALKGLTGPVRVEVPAAGPPPMASFTSAIARARSFVLNSNALLVRPRQLPS